MLNIIKEKITDMISNVFFNIGRDDIKSEIDAYTDKIIFYQNFSELKMYLEIYKSVTHHRFIENTIRFFYKERGTIDKTLLYMTAYGSPISKDTPSSFFVNNKVRRYACCG